MATGVICPRCHHSMTFYRLPIRRCSACREEFPAELRASAEANLRSQGTPRPLLLTVGMYCSPGIGALMVLFVLGAATGSGTFTVNGEAVSGADVWSSGGLPFLVLGAVCIAIGWGLVKRKPWSRHLMLLYWILVTATLVGQARVEEEAVLHIAMALVMGVLYVGPAAWYLYGKENVVAYYGSLEELAAAGGHSELEDE